MIAASSFRKAALAAAVAWGALALGGAAWAAPEEAGADGLTDREAAAFLSKLQEAAASGDGAKLAALSELPLRVNCGAKGRVERLSKPELVRSVGWVLGPKARAEIAAQKPQDLLRASAGAMVGDGVVWFRASGPESRQEVKVFAINSPECGAVSR